MTRQSGKRTQAVFRWSCSKKLRAAVMDFANGSRRADPWAAGIYAAATGRGCPAPARHPDLGPRLAAHHLALLARRHRLRPSPPPQPPLDIGGHSYVSSRTRGRIHRPDELPVEFAGDAALEAAADLAWGLSLGGAPG
jgi:hypothetical protein